MKELKILLIIILVVGIIFGVGIILGLKQTNNQSNANAPGWLSQFGAKFIPPQPLKLTDLKTTSATCLQQQVVVVTQGTDCPFAIQQSTFIERTATVQLLQGTSAVVTMTQEQMPPVQETLKRAGAITTTHLNIYPGKTHGVLDIQCTDANGGTACLLKLK